MAKQVPVLDITFESASLLTANTIAALNTTTGLAEAAGADDTELIGVVVENNGATAAPYFCKVRVNGIAQVKSDGTGAIAPGDQITSAASGKGKKRTPASGSVLRRILGTALNNVAATADLLIDVFLHPYDVIST
jgi:hypothetical protein